MSHDIAGTWRVIGTGFYISPNGIFVTARHVVEDVSNAGAQVSPLAIFHPWSETGLFGVQSYIVRAIDQCWISDTADIALGLAAQMTNNDTGQLLSHWNWVLVGTVPAVGELAATYAFPNHAVGDEDGRQTIHFRPDVYRGHVRKVDDFRDSVMLPFPFLEVDFRIHGAASGGPVIGRTGGVIGINCSENTPDGPAYATQIRCLEEAFLELPPSDGGPPRSVAFSELAFSGLVTIRDFPASRAGNLSGRVLRFGKVFDERTPVLSMEMSF